LLLVCFSGRVSHFCLQSASNLDPPISTSRAAGISGACEAWLVFVLMFH
jgi:hypothetical protein